MNRLFVPSLLAVIAAVLPGAARAAVSVDAPMRVIATNCRLEGWQYALEPDAKNLVRVELSPTLSNDQVTCVYQALADYNVPLDRPAPVEVRASVILKPNGTPQ